MSGLPNNSCCSILKDTSVENNKCCTKNVTLVTPPTPPLKSSVDIGTSLPLPPGSEDKNHQQLENVEEGSTFDLQRAPERRRSSKSVTFLTPLPTSVNVEERETFLPPPPTPIMKQSVEEENTNAIDISSIPIFSKTILTPPFPIPLLVPQFTTQNLDNSNTHKDVDDQRTEMLNSIRRGVPLKPVQQTDKPASIDVRDSLLSDIRKGGHLKPVKVQPKLKVKTTNIQIRMPQPAHLPKQNPK